MVPYITKNRELSGTHFAEVAKKARLLIRSIESRTKRRAYVRSHYFKKEKIFLEYFWPHLNQKPERERLNRLKYLHCGIELIENTAQKPTSKINPNSRDEILHRFIGITNGGVVFCVQIKQNTKKNQKFLMSIFPTKQKIPRK